MVAPSIAITHDTLSVRFDRFDQESYRLFLRLKTLPEYAVDFDHAEDAYTVSAPSRFAAMLGVERPQPPRSLLPLPEFLYDDQAAILRKAIDAKRFACWSDCGLGKTLIMLEFGRQVIHLTGGRFLIVTLNELVNQFVEMAQEFYGDSLPVLRLRSREEMREWAKGVRPECMLAITNYEKFNPDKQTGQVVNELRHLGGIGVDESHRLAAGGGKQKWALIHSSKGIPYKLSCTATPAPNDTIEFASQASFLEKMRTDGEIIWTYFYRHPKTQEWTVRPHARDAFFKFMASWSIYVRDPRRYGWRKDHQEVPPPDILVHHIDPTDEQTAEFRRLCVDQGGQWMLLDTTPKGIVVRSKLSQVAKGFLYQKESANKYRRIQSAKPDYVAGLVEQELLAGRQTLVWTVFTAEADLIAEACDRRQIVYEILRGATPEAERIEILDRFRAGQSSVLISLASMVGYGQNFRHCGAMVYSGWNDSYVAYYQSMRRAYGLLGGRFEGRLRVHIPVIPLLEGDMLDNLYHKQAQHEAAIEEMETAYLTATVMGRSR